MMNDLSKKFEQSILDNEHRTGRPPHNFFRCAAKEKIFKSGTAVGADYKHIWIDRFLKLQNLIVGYPFSNFCFYIYFLTERKFVDLLFKGSARFLL